MSPPRCPFPQPPSSTHLGYAQPCPPPLYSRRAGRAPKSFTPLKARRCQGAAKGTDTLSPCQHRAQLAQRPPRSLSPRSSRSSPGARPPGWLALSTAVPWQEKGWRRRHGGKQGQRTALAPVQTCSLEGEPGSRTCWEPRDSSKPRSCTHPGCCACRGGRSAAGGARGPRSPGETRGHTAAPAATAGREAGGRREP